MDEANKRMAFRWRDYADSNKNKVMWLSCEEFIRRFLQHILPHRFSKVRYYGLLANRDKGKRLNKCRRTLGRTAFPILEMITWKERFYRLTGVDPTSCPCCEQGKMVTISLLLPAGLHQHQAFLKSLSNSIASEAKRLVNQLNKYCP